MNIDEQLRILNEVAYDILLTEISALDTAKMINKDRNEMRERIKTPDAQRARADAKDIEAEKHSADPLVRRKVMLQQQLAHVIKQIKQREAQELRKQGIK